MLGRPRTEEAHTDIRQHYLTCPVLEPTGTKENGKAGLKNHSRVDGRVDAETMKWRRLCCGVENISLFNLESNCCLIRHYSTRKMAWVISNFVLLF